MTTTSVGMRCPECSGRRTSVRKVAAARADEPILTYVLLGAIVLIELGAMATGASAAGGSSDLLRDGGLTSSAIADGELYRLVTSGFLHFGVVHLLFNGFSLYILGSMLEPAIGRLRFAVIYFVSLLTGSLGALLADPGALTAGASGAVFGLMGAAFFFMRSRGIDPMQSGLGLWLGLNLVLSLRPGISWGGHLGGLVGGALAALILFELRDRIRMPRWAPLVLAGAVGVAAVVASIAVA
jgi:membrane associated rhomboid family serine protease